MNSTIKEKRPFWDWSFRGLVGNEYMGGSVGVANKTAPEHGVVYSLYLPGKDISQTEGLDLNLKYC